MLRIDIREERPIQKPDIHEKKKYIREERLNQNPKIHYKKNYKGPQRVSIGTQREIQKGDLIT